MVGHPIHIQIQIILVLILTGYLSNACLGTAKYDMFDYCMEQSDIQLVYALGGPLARTSADTEKFPPPTGVWLSD